jgi:hypothetical protein
MKNVVYLKSDQDIVDFIEKNRAQAQIEAVMGVMLWLSAESIMVDVWKN